MNLDKNDLEFADKICRAWWTVGEALKKWLRAKTKELAPKAPDAETIDVTRLGSGASLYDHQDSQR